MTGAGRILVAAVAFAATASAQQLPSFRAGVDVVSLSVTVTDAAGRYVTDLTPEQLNIFEDGAKQDVAYFNRTSVPIALVLLLDTSSSMDDKMATAKEAAVGFARRVRPQDLGQLIGFADRVEVLQPFTSDQAALERAIRKTVANGSTTLYNALYIALKELKKVRAAVEEDVRRQAIVVFTDGEDTSSLVGFDELLDLARRSETAIYAIALRSPRESRPGLTRSPTIHCGSWLNRPEADRSSRPASRTSRAPTRRSPMSWRTSTSSGSSRRTPGETAPGGN